jgi:KUP system potassium uptake protein
VATIIASQAVISGAFFDHAAGDATGVCAADGSAAHVEPRDRPGLSSGHQPDAVRGVVALVLGFGTSTSLAAAYGFAVTGTMATTTVLAFVVARGSGAGTCPRAWLCSASSSSSTSVFFARTS